MPGGVRLTQGSNRTPNRAQRVQDVAGLASARTASKAAFRPCGAWPRRVSRLPRRGAGYPPALRYRPPPFREPAMTRQTLAALALCLLAACGGATPKELAEQP